MPATLAFDVYGTLINPLGIATALEAVISERASEFASAWRDKQIEYLFRRGLGRNYQPFSVCTAQAFDYTCQQFQQAVAQDDRERILGCYTDLPVYAGTTAALQRLQDAGVRSFAFSNGEPEDLELLLTNAGLRDYLDGIVSVHDMESFKPDPAVYAHFLSAAKCAAADTWLVSGNPFDVIGAYNAGWKTAWLQRDPAQLFDPWGVTPDVVVGELSELGEALP